MDKITNFMLRDSHSTHELGGVDLYCENRIVSKGHRVLFLKYLIDGKPFLNYEKLYLDRWTWHENRYLKTRGGFINIKVKFFISKKIIQEIIIVGTLLNIKEI